MIQPDHPTLSIVQQCRLASIGRSTFIMPRGESAENLGLMVEIDRQFLETPFYGAQQMTWHLHAAGHAVNIKRVRRLMRLMGLMPIYRQPPTSIPAQGIYLHAFSGGREARQRIGGWVVFYNHRRPHAAHDGETPVRVYRGRLSACSPGLRPDRHPTALAA